MMTQVPSEHPQRGMGRRTRLFLAASLAAAVLVIGVLVVTTVLLFSRHSTGNEPQPTTHPISITLSNCASLPTPLLVDLCTHHQFKDLLQWRKMGDYVLVLERAYIDMNQLVITYRVFSQSNGQQMLVYQDMVITTSQGQSFTPSVGESVRGGPQVDQFSTTPVPAETQTLQLHVEVNRFYIEVLPRPLTLPAPQSTAVHGPVTFDFTLEYHGGPVVTPHQTVTVKGISVKLGRVMISPSETIIEGTTKGTLPSSPDYTFSLDAAGRSFDPGFSPFGGDSNPFSVDFYDALLGRHGTWTFQIHYEPGTDPFSGSPRVPEGPWVFHFIVT